MKRFWTKTIWDITTTNASTELFINEGFENAQLFLKAAAWTAGTFTVEFSPNKTDFYPWEWLSVTLSGTETWNDLKSMFYVSTSVPYIRVISTDISAGSVNVIVSFQD